MAYPIKNIIFDLGGVIINLNQQLTIEAFKVLFDEHFELLYEKLEQDNWLNRFEVGEFSEKEFYGFFKNYKNVSDIALQNAWNAMLLDIPKDRLELIKHYSKKYNVYLLSNTNIAHYSYIDNYVSRNFNGLKFNTLFKNMYLSHEVGFRKPNKSIFEYVLNDANIKPEETLFIDDTEDHINTAKILGIQTHHLNLKENQKLTDLFDEY
jgi:putative hydrolase of the HAD superfamily